MSTPTLHSKRGFSGSKIFLACGGSVAMSEGFPNETNGEAELGTAVHDMVDTALKLGLSCHDFIGSTFNNIVMTEEDADAGQVYVNYIRQLKQRFPHGEFYYEVKVGLTSIGDDLWGTTDFLMIDRLNRTLWSLDYKNGYELVEVNEEQLVTGYGTIQGNSQTMGYALAAMDTFKLWGAIDKIVSGIIQPNNEDHEDGVIRLKEYTYDEFVKWHNAYSVAYGRNDLVAGSHCKYCRAAGSCAVRIQRTMTLLGFTSSLATADEDQVIAILDELPALRRTMKAIEDQAIVIARKGKQMQKWKLTRAIVRGFCTDEDAFVNKVADDYISDQVTGGMIHPSDTDCMYVAREEFIKSLYNKPKLKGMTAQKANKKLVDKTLVNKYFDKPEAGYQLVPITHRSTAIMPDKQPTAANKFKAV